MDKQGLPEMRVQSVDSRVQDRLGEPGGLIHHPWGQLWHQGRPSQVRTACWSCPRGHMIWGFEIPRL